MKKLLLLFTLFLTMAVAAQKPTAQKVQINTKTSIGSNENLSASVKDINNRVDALVKDIEALYDTYNTMEDKWFQNDGGGVLGFFKKDNKEKESKIGRVQMQQDSLRNRIEKAQNVIDSLKSELRWIDTLRMYYEKGSLDDLYRGDDRHPKADLKTLQLHKKILGTNCPKKMDDLLLLAQCAQSLNEEYNAPRNRDYLNRLGKVADCDTKWDLDGLLAVYGDIKDEVDKWKDNSLRGFMTFKNYLKTEYGVDLETDFPDLAKQARKKAGLSNK